MKLKKDFIVHHAQGESVLVPTGDASFSGVVRGNKILGQILDLLKEGATREGILSHLHETYDAPEGAIEADVDKAISELERIGALE